MLKLSEKYPHLEVSISNFKDINDNNLIFGSEFNGKTRKIALLNIKSDKKVIDYFDLISENVSILKEKSLVYDLTHSLGNFLQDTQIYDQIGSNKKIVSPGDLIISRLRSYLREISVILPKDLPQLVSTEYLVYRPKTDLISSDTLMIFTLSDYVQTILNLSQYGTEHPRFYEFVFNELPIPQVVFELNDHINNLMKNAYYFFEISKNLYKQAEILLYTELGLDPNDPLKSIEKSQISTNNFTVLSAKESFLRTGRLDSEYYQIKFDKIENLIRNYKGGFDFLTISDIKDKNFTPLLNTKYRYIELSNIGANGDISGFIYDFGSNLPTRARRLVKTGDLIISSIEGSLTSCALITQEFNGCLVSTGFYVLNINSVNSETLLVLFKSKIFQEYLKKFTSGTILTAISKDELQKVPIPKIDKEVQNFIALNLQKSFDLRKEARELLNEAKNKVEAAISRERERERERERD